MPLNAKAQKVMDSMTEQYGVEKGERVFYATANKQGRTPETWEKKVASTPADVTKFYLQRALGKKAAAALDKKTNEWENELQSISHHVDDAQEHAQHPVVQDALGDIEEEVVDSAHRMPGNTGDIVLQGMELGKQAKEGGRCWEGYEPVPGKEPYSDDSCRPKGSKKKKSAADLGLKVAIKLAQAAPPAPPAPPAGAPPPAGGAPMQMQDQQGPVNQIPGVEPPQKLVPQGGPGAPPAGQAGGGGMPAGRPSTGTPNPATGAQPVNTEQLQQNLAAM